MNRQNKINIKSKPKYSFYAILLIIILLTAIGLFLILFSRASTIKPPITGVLDRNGLANSTYRNTVNGFVLNLKWRDVQPISSSDFITTKIDSAVASAKVNGASLKIRFFAGAQTRLTGLKLLMVHL